ncbi:MAG: hypothetical protein IPM81_01980 [Saprospirales bacterium]|jgi:hypothetical protein|nr:hypothetical protein [Saprospirales bacterium]
MFPKGIVGLNMFITAYYGYEINGGKGAITGFIVGGILVSMLYTLLTPEKLVLKSEVNSTGQVKLSAIVMLVTTLAAMKFNNELHGEILLWFKDYFAVAVLVLLISLSLYRLIQAINVIEDYYYYEDVNVSMIIAIPLNLIILLWIFIYFVN